MPSWDFFDALQPNEHASTWLLQHEHVPQEEAAEAARLRYAAAEESRF
jgi:hypothetical protein